MFKYLVISSYKNRNERRGGDVGLYIKDSIEYKVGHDLTRQRNVWNICGSSVKERTVIKAIQQQLYINHAQMNRKSFMDRKV